MMPLWQGRISGGLSTGSVCAVLCILLYHNGSESWEMVPLRHGWQRG